MEERSYGVTLPPGFKEKSSLETIVADRPSHESSRDPYGPRLPHSLKQTPQSPVRANRSSKDDDESMHPEMENLSKLWESVTEEEEASLYELDHSVTHKLDNTGSVMLPESVKSDVHGSALKTAELKHCAHKVLRASTETCTYGPALPPPLQEKESEQRDIGPKLPPYLVSSSGEVPSESSGSGLYGPALPPLPPAKESEHKDMGPKLPEHLASLSGEVPSESSGSSLYGPALPPLPLAKESEHKDMGPKLPEHLASLSGEVPSESSGSGLYGPALPPRPPVKESEHKDMGPKLPEHLASLSGEVPSESSGSGLYGPALPPRPPANESELKDIGPKLPPYLANSSGDIADTDSDSDEEFMIGPIPVSGDASRNTSAAEEFEARAKKMKDKLTGQTKEMPAERESWMIELPPEMGKNFGLGPRTFRKRASCGDKDKSAWTDTPADKERKAKEAWERHEKGLRKPKRERPPPPAISAKEKELADQMESYNKKKRSESLIDMHTNKLSKKKKEEGEKPNERKEFDRDTDLQVNRFDDARRRAAMKKAVGLNDRFSSGGHTSKFL